MPLSEADDLNAQGADERWKYSKGTTFLPHDVSYRNVSRPDVASSLGEVDRCAEPQNADEEYRHGVRCQRENRLTEAFQHFQRALAVRPDYAPAHNNLGVIRQQWGQLDAAAAAYLEAIKANPQFGLAWCNLGNCFREDNRLE